MAKMKTYAVTVVIPIERTYFVNARKPNGAVAKLQSDEGWTEATRYDRYEEPDEWTPMQFPKNAEVTNVSVAF